MSTRSIYQNNGKPLSQQAIYQQKLRQGVYNSPGSPSVGVNSNASDTAALLAASADLTVKPSYERVVAVEAHNAAAAARNGTTSTFSSISSSAVAAAAALGKQGGTGIPEYSGSSVFDKATTNSTYSLSTRTDPERDYRSGLATKSSQAALNIGKISSVANKNSSKSLNSRFNPDLDFRSGLQSSSNAEYLDDDEEKLAAQGAAASLKFGGSTSNTASSSIRSKSFTANQVVNKTLLDAANKAAEKRLSALNSSQPLDFKQQAQLYANALTLAQERSNERIANHKVGVIDLGGGLTILQSELEKMAALVVQPVLDDIKTKADKQREIDDASSKKQQERVAEHEKYKKEEFNKKLQEKIDLERAKKERLDLHEERKAAEADKYTEYQTGVNEEVEAKVQELRDLEAKYEEEKAELLAEKQAELDRIESEEAELINGRKEELMTLQAEKDEILKPTLDELKIENEKLSEVTNARDELLNEVKASETTNEEYTNKLKELEEKLAAAEAEFEEYTTKVEESTKKDEETSKVLADLQSSSAKELEEAENEDKDLDSKLAALEKEKEENLKSKAENKTAILAHLDEKVAHEHKINEELPEHLRTEIDEKKLKDTSSLFSKEDVPEPKVEKVSESKEAEKPAAPTSTAKAAAAAAAVSKTSSSKSLGLKKFAKKYFSSKPDPDRYKLNVKTAPKAAAVATPATPAKAKEPVEKSPAKSESKDDEIETIGDESLTKNSAPGGLFKEEI